MGATIIKNAIYIDKKLVEQLTKNERRVLIAHELSHYMHRDNAVIAVIAVLCFGFMPAINFFRRKMEERADRDALVSTRNFGAFCSLMDKLQHDGVTHPTKERRIKVAYDALSICLTR
mgnify:CR=1 FL=1